MESTTPKPFVFVLMPFHEEFGDTYQLGIKQACSDAGAYCERVDEQKFEGRITDRVYNQISKADIIVAEMTGRNPNVFYETGYAHALDKRVILITKKGEDIPFDLKDYPHIIYKSLTDLKTELERRVRWCIDNPKDNLNKTENHLEVFVNGTNIIYMPRITVDDPDLFRLKDEVSIDIRLYLKVDIHNVSNQLVFDPYKVGLEAPVGLLMNDINLKYIFSESGVIFISPLFPEIFPNEWTTLTFNGTVVIDEENDFPQESVLILYIYSSYGVIKMPFNVVLEIPSDIFSWV